MTSTITPEYEQYPYTNLFGVLFQMHNPSKIILERDVSEAKNEFTYFERINNKNERDVVSHNKQINLLIFHYLIKIKADDCSQFQETIHFVVKKPVTET